MNSRKVKKVSFKKRYWELSFPLILQNLFQLSLQHIDLMMVGQLGLFAVAGVGLMNSLYLIFMMIFVAFAFSLFPLLTQLYGSKEKQEYDTLVTRGFQFCFLLGLLLIPLFYFLAQWACQSYELDHASQRAAMDYVRGLCWSLPFLGASIVLESALRAAALNALELKIKGLVLALNTILNACLIFGLGAFPNLGAFGAGFATSVSRMIGVLFILALCAKKDLLPFSLPLSTKGIIRKDLKEQLIRYAKILIFQDILWSLAIFLYARSFSSYGSEVLAIYNLIYLMDRMADSVLMALSWSAGTLIGQDLGNERLNRAWIRSRQCMKSCLKHSIWVILLLLLVTPAVFWVYSIEYFDAILFLQLLGVHCLVLPIKSLGMVVLIGILRSGGDHAYSAAVELGLMYFFSVPACLLAALYFYFPPVIPYLMIQLEWVLKTILLSRRHRSKKWVRRLV